MRVHHLAAVSSLALLAGCLEARQGGLAGEPDDGAAATPELAGCTASAVPAFALVSSRVDGVAVGACGHLAFVDQAAGPSDDAWQRVALHAPNGRELAIFPEDGGWFGRLAFAPGDALFAFETFRSDLGFGDWTVIDPAAPSTPLAVSGFGAMGPFGFASDGNGPIFWHCGPEGHGDAPGALAVVGASGRRVLAEGVHCELLTVAGDHGAIVVAPVARTEQVASVTWWNLATGASGALPTGFTARWSYGDTVRYRDALAVSADGALVAVQPVVELYIGSPHEPVAPQEPVEVYAREGGALVATLVGDVREAVLPARGEAIVVGGEAGTSWLLDGTTGELPGARPLHAFTDPEEVLVRTGDGALALLELATGAVTPMAGTSAAGGFRVSTGGSAIAFAEPTGDQWVIRVWRRDDGELREVARSALAPPLHWVGASGAVLASVADPAGAPPSSTTPGGPAIGHIPTLFSADGGRMWRGDGRLLDLHEVGWGLLVSLHPTNDVLVALDTGTGRSREILEGHDHRTWVDAASERVAVRYGPLSATSSSLYFGRLQRP